MHTRLPAQTPGRTRALWLVSTSNARNGTSLWRQRLQTVSNGLARMASCKEACPRMLGLGSSNQKELRLTAWTVTNLGQHVIEWNTEDGTTSSTILFTWSELLKVGPWCYLWGLGKYRGRLPMVRVFWNELSPFFGQKYEQKIQL